uniref:UnbV_ASPIC domain-containing protein n=1 Tax=Ascaris lumbricoides TaxID=6252 RepID=A0A0M3HZG3_ASCLU
MDAVSVDLQSPHPCHCFTLTCFLGSRSREEVQALTLRWKDRPGGDGLRLKNRENEYMECGQQVDGTTAIDGVDLTMVAKFKYLGPVISSDDDLVEDIRTRNNATWAK